MRTRTRAARPEGAARRAVLLAAMAALGAFASGCEVAVAAGLDETDANRVVVALDGVGIDAVKVIDPDAEGKFRVEVPRDDAARSLATMADEQLPRARSRGVLDATDKGALVPSQAAEHAALVAGLAGELEHSLANVDGVLSARVHLNVPERDALRDGPPPTSTASVLLEHRGATPPLTIEAIQRIVSGGAPALAPSDVAVVFVAHPSRPQIPRSELAHVGPITVARGSLTSLKAALGGLVLVVLALAAATLALWSRLGRLQRELEAQAHAAIGATNGSGVRAGGGVPSVRHPAAVSVRPPGYGPGPSP